MSRYNIGVVDVGIANIDYPATTLQQVLLWRSHTNPLPVFTPLSVTRVPEYCCRISFLQRMRQRVGLAQAILHRPAILFLDEPTSGLDPIGIKMLRDLVMRLNTEFGMTIFMNTHLISEIAKTCTSIAVLSHGKLVYHDRIEAVTARYGDDAALEELYLSLTPVGRLAEVA